MPAPLSVFRQAPQVVSLASQIAIPVLETERLILRAPRRDDVNAIVRLVNDRRVAENTARIPHPDGVDDAERFIAAVNCQDGEAVFAIMRDHDLIGVCGVEPRENAPEIGYWLGAPFWSRGYATEAVRAAIDYTFGALGHDSLQAGARVGNSASRRVLEKCGFQWTGVGLYRIRAIHSSAPIDRVRLERGIWQAIKGWGRSKKVVQ